MYFHHNTIRKYTTSLLKIFNDIEVPRFKEDGSVQKVINVPIKFSTMERAVTLIEDEHTANGVNSNVLPKMALSLNSMSKDTARDTNKYARDTYYDVDGVPVKYNMNSVAYSFSYTLHIIARTMSDLTMIVEQILPLFRPTYNIRIKELDIKEETTSIPVSLDGVSFDFDYDGDEDSDIRMVTADIDLTMRGNLYLPIKEAKIIEHVYANFIENGKILTTVEEHAYDDDTIDVGGNDTP
jgi:hypothetical protein